MLVDRSTGKHIAGEASPSINEEIEKYSKDVKIPEGGSTLFKTGNTFRYAYFDKEIKKLVLIDFGGK